jgi:hypothetical protein
MFVSSNFLFRFLGVFDASDLLYRTERASGFSVRRVAEPARSRAAR